MPSTRAKVGTAMNVRVEFGDYELDEARFELRRGGERIAVQPKVLELLVYLVRHRDRVVPKEELLDAVWAGTVVTEASLTQALSLARRALGDSAGEQHSIRTVRRRGLQFVAPLTTARRAPGPTSQIRSPVSPMMLDATGASLLETAGASQLETAGEIPRPRTTRVPSLYLMLDGEAPFRGGACWSLADVDEVQITRASRRKVERTRDVTRVLTLSVPGKRLSRRHAQLTRTPQGWVLVDEGSRNGTRVAGERVDKHRLADGDVFECARVLFRFELDGGTEDVDSRSASNALGTLSPRWLPLARDLDRMATATVPLLLLGETGAGKTHLAERLHRASGRPGPLVRLDAASLDAEAAGDASAEAGIEDGTLLVEGIEHVDAELAPRLIARLDADPSVSVIATSVLSFETLQERIPGELLMRLAGFRAVLPPLRERLGDLGALIAVHLEGNKALSIDGAAARALVSYRWPGNLRELAHVVKAGCRLADGTLRLDQLPAEMRPAATD
jgi:DNA-binding winged helix-turn-helix (wHTH) protein